jgi:hypothetical protein
MEEPMSVTVLFPQTSRKSGPELSPAPANPAPSEADPSLPRARFDRAKTQALYEAAIGAVGAGEAEVLRLAALSAGRRLRRAVEQGRGVSAAQAADAWLVRRLGYVDDPARRALVATLALVLDPGVSESGPDALPLSLLSLYPAAHHRLATALQSERPYETDLFVRDLAFATGFFVPAGALTVAVPARRGVAPLLRLKPAAGAFGRVARASGWAAGIAHARAAGLSPWAELHVDTRSLRDFDREGFLRCYRRLADLLRLRSDLAGVYGASWLYDPGLTKISPRLAFVRETAIEGGGRLVPLRTEPVQIAYAVARSAVRRSLWMNGRYKPACYGMYWPRARLLDWAAQDTG